MSFKRLRPQMYEDACNLPQAKLRRKHARADSAEKLVPSQQLGENASGRPSTPPSAHSSAMRDTPHRQSSSHPCSIPRHLSHSLQNRTLAETLSPAASEEAKVRHTSFKEASRNCEEMGRVLGEEINGAVYEYPVLCNEFFRADEPHIDDILERIAGKEPENNLIRRHKGQWTIDTSSLTHESATMHQDCAKLLDLVMHAAFHPDRFRPSAQTIVPGQESRMIADHSEDSSTSPDIVQGVSCNGARHWGDLEFFAECKGSRGKLDEALMQIVRYSRATFTHQIYRRHIYSLAICGTEATFVRISRSDILHSLPIDLTNNAEQFLRAAAGLFALDDDAFGYNTNFYYWPPLENKAETTDRQLRVQTGRWRWVVVEILCHRMCVIGRATVVLLLRRVGCPSHHSVLKLIWRPNDRADESLSLAEFGGCYGVCQCRWKGCGGSTVVQDPSLLIPSPVQHHFFPITLDDKDRLPASGSRQRNPTLAKIKREKGRKYHAGDVRHYSMILMDEGVSLWRIKHLVHVLRTLRDGIVGYASVAERGKVHRDISAGNILCRPHNAAEVDEKELWDPKCTPDLDESEDIPISGISDRHNFDDITFLVREERIQEASSLEEYTSQRYTTQKPLGSLFDFEFMVPESRKECEVQSFSDRTGTVAFMSAHLLLASESQPVVHSFLHDLESFFWVFLWLIFTRAKVTGRMTSESRKLFTNLFLDEENSPAWKHLHVRDPLLITRVIKPLVEDTEWEKAGNVAMFFSYFLVEHLYLPSGSKSNGMPSLDAMMKTTELGPKLGPQLPEVVSREDKWDVIRKLIEIFDTAISVLQQPVSSDDASS